MCTVQAISCLTRRINKLLGGNEGIFKEIFVSATKFCHRNKSQILSDLILCDLLQRQNSVAEAKIFTKIPQYTRHLLPLFVAMTCCCKLLPSVCRPLRIQPSFFPKFKNVCDHTSVVSMVFLHTMLFITDKTILMLL